jgi:F-type H+-transporting ATPase subunit d
MVLFPLTEHISSFQLEKMKNIIPFDQMTIEDLNEVFPETKLDKKKYPYWPHQPIENL